MFKNMATAPITYLHDYRHPDEELVDIDGLKDLWTAVIANAVTDYKRGLARKQHLKFADPVHSSHQDALNYTEWVEAAHWLLCKAAI